MNIAEKISHAFNRIDTTKKHPANRKIAVKDLLTSYGFVGIQLLAAGLMAACNNTNGGTGGQPREQVDMGSTFQGYYCQIDVKQNQYTGTCNWIADHGNDCPEEYVDQRVVSGNVHWRLQRDKDQYGNQHRKCSVTTKQN